jgi:hypothetical protein
MCRLQRPDRDISAGPAPLDFIFCNFSTEKCRDAGCPEVSHGLPQYLHESGEGLPRVQSSIFCRTRGELTTGRGKLCNEKSDLFSSTALRFTYALRAKSTLHYISISSSYSLVNTLPCRCETKSVNSVWENHRFFWDSYKIHEYTLCQNVEFF